MTTDPDRALPARERRLLLLLEQLLALESVELEPTLRQIANLVLTAFEAEKTDIFLFEPARASLVAVGTSDTPLARLQRSLGLDVMALANGGRTVDVFQHGEKYHTGQAERDPSVLRGVREGMGVRSILAVPLDVQGERRGLLELSSTQPERFSAADLDALQAIANWVGLVMHRAELVTQITRSVAAQARTSTAEELITTLAHDLRNHITPLLAGIQLLARRAERAGRADDQRTLARLEQAGTRLSQLVADLLDVRRLDGLALAMTELDLRALCHETLRGFDASSPITLNAPHPVLVQGDASKLRQIVENLLWNALKHTPAGTAITVTLREEQRGASSVALLEVADSGPGIAAELLPTLFERFTRGEASQGLGLGLFVARTIAEAHGGELAVQSMPGSGTTFRLALPSLAPIAEA